MQKSYLEPLWGLATVVTTRRRKRRKKEEKKEEKKKKKKDKKERKKVKKTRKKIYFINRRKAQPLYVLVFRSRRISVRISYLYREVLTGYGFEIFILFL